MLTVIILTYNEEIHLSRLLANIASLTRQVVVVDSFSSDKTVEIARYWGAVVYQNTFVNNAHQFQWALDHCNIDTEWVMKLDADEYLTEELLKEIHVKLPRLGPEVTGVYLKRQVHFMGAWIKYGGYYPITLLRIWRVGVGAMEQKWMDEHIKLSHGETVEFVNDFIDENLNNLSWWVEKHNKYATREAIEYLNGKYEFFKVDAIDKDLKTQESVKRKLKDNYYNKLPLFFRAFIYFLYRYFFKLGFLDHKKGLIWHFLQGFWYRFLVDAKIYQIENLAKERGVSVRQVLESEFGIKIIS